jgi:hypothetical protein
MLRGLGQLLLRGGVSVGICAIAALSISGFLSVIAANLQPRAVTQNVADRGCRPSHCRAKPGDRPQTVTTKAQ